MPENFFHGSLFYFHGYEDILESTKANMKINEASQLRSRLVGASPPNPPTLGDDNQILDFSGYGPNPIISIITQGGGKTCPSYLEKSVTHVIMPCQDEFYDKVN